MGGIELPQLGEGRFQRSPHSPERSGLLLDDLIVENVDGSAMKVKIAGLWVIYNAARVACATFVGLPIGNRPVKAMARRVLEKSNERRE
jgi:hypothetical protein